MPDADHETQHHRRLFDQLRTKLLDLSRKNPMLTSIRSSLPPIGWSSFFIVSSRLTTLLISVIGIGAKHAVALWLLQGPCVSARG